MDKKHLDNWIQKRKERRSSRSVDQLFESIKAGNREALSSAITLVESSLQADRKKAAQLIELCLPFSGNAIRVGVTGVPGVGKSTFIEAFGSVLVEKKKRVAVLAIDPSSAQSGGSILGDKTRMQQLSTMDAVFIRPSAAGKSLGGVAAKTKEAMLLCEAAGYNVILVETVGVGQSETLVHAMVDFFLLLMLSGAGDELQGIKRGIMEMADALVITKADGDNQQKAEMACRQYANSIHLFPPKQSGWVAKTTICSALENRNIDAVWEMIETYVRQSTLNGWFELNRREQDKFWLNQTIKELIVSAYYDNKEFQEAILKAEQQVFEGKMGAINAAEELYENFKKKV
jgi:LAO/AO transport system kinase